MSDERPQHDGAPEGESPAAADVRRTIDEVRRLLDDAASSGDLAARAEDIRARLRASLDAFDSRAHDGEARLRRTLEEERDEAERKIRENPLGAVLVAAGLGLLVGLVIRRR